MPNCNFIYLSHKLYLDKKIIKKLFGNDNFIANDIFKEKRNFARDFLVNVIL